jgi:hypothetical protein
MWTRQADRFAGDERFVWQSGSGYRFGGGGKGEGRITDGTGSGFTDHFWDERLGDGHFGFTYSAGDR